MHWGITRSLGLGELRVDDVVTGIATTGVGTGTGVSTRRTSTSCSPFLLIDGSAHGVELLLQFFLCL